MQAAPAVAAKPPADEASQAVDAVDNARVAAASASTTTLAPARPPTRALVRLLERATAFMQRRTVAVCVVLLLAGLLWVCLFPAVCITTGELKMRGTYMSENSLSAGFQRSAFSDDDIRRAHARDDVYRSIIEQHAPPRPLSGGVAADSASTTTNRHRALAAQIADDMRTAGLEVHRQAFGPSSNNSGENVWGIVRGVRASGTESIVLVASFAHFANQSATDPSGLSLLVDFARKLRNTKWVAKDVVLLATSSLLSRSGAGAGGEAGGPPAEDGLGFGFGVHKWLQAYHASDNNDEYAVAVAATTTSNSMAMHVGRIRAAIVLDMPGGEYRGLAVPLPGLNGGLPNLDMFNAWQASWTRHGGTRGGRLLPSAGALSDGFSRALAMVEPQLRALLGPQQAQPFVLYADRLLNVLRFMTQLAFEPGGSHAHFLRYNIDAMTLQPTAELDPDRTWGFPMRASRRATGFSAGQLMHSLEDAVHSLSNLEERLHQSFYFYFLANEKMFVSIDEYIFSLGIFLSPCVVLALKAATSSSSSSPPPPRSVGVWLGAAFLAVAVLAGAVPTLFTAPDVGDDAECEGGGVEGSEDGRGWGSAVAVHVDWTRAWAAGASAAVLLVVHPLMARVLTEERRRSARVSIRVVVLLVLFYSHMTCGLMNFPLALFSAVSLTPVVAAHSGPMSAATRLVCSAAILFASPLLWEVAVPLLLQGRGRVVGGMGIGSAGGGADTLRVHATEWHSFGSLPHPFFGMVVVPLQLTALSMLWM